jgi:hypothetical protein
MLLLIGIASAWCICCAMAVALCVMASRGDRAMERAVARIGVSEPDVEVAFVATFAEPEAAPAPAPSVVRRSRVS